MSTPTITAPPRTRIFGFPDIVNEYAARTVATGVVVLAASYVVTGWSPLLVVLAYGFVARVATGPRLSPLGQLATKVVVPRLGLPTRLTAGAPKRFAQGIGATLSLVAVVLRFGFDAVGASQVVVGMIAGAATLEAAFGYCIGCKIFALLMRWGVIPTEVCEACADISRRPAAA